MTTDTTKVPAVEQGDLLVFRKDGKWTLVRVDYGVTRRWLSVARGSDAADLDAAIAAAREGAAKVRAPKETGAKKERPAKAARKGKPKARRAQRDPTPETAAAPSA